ncbi:MAG: M1 family aminopeptidase, partial [Pseudomonadota bacterium]
MSGPAAASIHHEIQLTLLPERGEIQVLDRIRLPESKHPPEFLLAEGLDVKAHSGILTPLGRHHGLVRYRLSEVQGEAVTLSYEGRPRTDGADIFGMPRGVVDASAVFLGASSGWYPLFDSQSLTFDLKVQVQEGWWAVGQDLAREIPGGGFEIRMPHPQDDILLVAAPFTRYTRTGGEHRLEVFLLDEDAELAARYLDVMGAYLDFYGALIGPYPYQRFAVVENRWQTGYGMPSFTLLGSRVLRLPFLLHSSLPHEILHNWLGNGVFIDASAGNWSEGLTAYLADYLIKEARGRGAEHRHRALARYSDFAADQRDFPLAEFRARHSDTTQAVGYDKSLMLFHMIRAAIGDRAFIAGLQSFYAAHRFAPARYTDLLAAFHGAGFDAEAFQRQWLDRAGAP